MQTKKKRISGKRRDAISVILFALMAILTLYVISCQVQNRLPFFGKYAIVRITTPSMEPSISVNEYILIEKIGTEEAKELSEGTVIVFNSRDPYIFGKLNTHRIDSVDPDGNYITKGDNNPKVDDYPVLPSDIAGVYVCNIDWLTRASSYIVDNIALVGVIAFLLVAFYFVITTASDILEKKHKTEKELVKAEIEKLRLLEDEKRELDERIAKEVERLKRAAKDKSSNGEK